MVASDVLFDPPISYRSTLEEVEAWLAELARRREATTNEIELRHIEVAEISARVKLEVIGR